MSTSHEFGLSLVSVRRTAVLAVLFLAAVFLPRSASAQSVFGTVSPRQVSYIGTLTYTATASGLDPATTQYAYFRRRPGGTWIPSINSPNWTSSGSFTWRPTLSDVGVWETYVWAKDGNTPPTQNTYGYAAGHNTQPIEVFGPPTVPGPTSASCAYSESGVCWVTGDFVISVSPSTGGLGSLIYHICRSNDTTGWGGCDVHLTMNGGTSITVSGSHLPSDGYRRVYYFQSRDSAGAYSGWNNPLYVKIDRYAPSVAASNASDLWYSHRTATISASDSHSGLQSVRYSWNSAPNASCTTGTSTSSGATLTVPGGDNLLYVCARDNTGRVAQWSGRYRVSPLTVTGTVSPSRGSYLGTFTSTATAAGGTPSTTRFAFFRRRPGGTWIPAVTAPVWQTSNVHVWQPTLADEGMWETYIWVKDGDTPPGWNTYGYSAGVNTGMIEVVGKPTIPGPTTVACAYAVGDDCWVAGDFTASVAASTGGMGTLNYHICRSNDTTGWGGCDVHLTFTGGTSILVSGTHLPADGYRRAYYFQTQDSAGAYSGWNTPRFVRVDRYTPTVSATNASATEWFYSRTATVSASDAHSGVQSVRYAWNAALDAACTTGTATSIGAVLTAPVGDNTLYLCAKDNVGRVGQWSGRYRIANPLSLPSCSVSPTTGSYVGTFTQTATASGGIPATTRFAFFRRRPGGTWIPAVTAPVWQAANTYPWSLAASDAGTWELYVWVKDESTPPTQNTYGYAAGCNSGLITVVGPPTVPGPTTVACAWTSGEDCWVTGDFTASVTASTGGMGSLVYQICRSNDKAAGVFGGCEVNLTLSGGTSILVSGTHLPSDGFRRSYWFQAKDSAGAPSGWNTQRYVRVDRYAPAVGATNASDTTWYSYRAATVSATDSGSGVQAVRYSWNAALDAGCTTGTATTSGTALVAPAGDNLLYLCAKDNTGRVGQWSGRYRVAPLSLTGTVGPKPASYLQTVTYTATATGGTPSTIQYAFFRRRPNGTWIPAVTAPNWQPAPSFSWQPTISDVGTWETYIWVKDGDTPPTMNTYGYAVGHNTGLIDIVGKPTVPGPTTVTCAWTSGEDCWVQGDFTASVTASTGGLGSLVYQICRSNDKGAGVFGGCEENLTLTGGTSILVSGTHLPGDGFRRSYWFQAKDSAGALSGWNTQRYVRVDRYAPTVSATNASDTTSFSYRAATVSASDTGTGGSGVQSVRYSWNTALDANCTTGTATASGAALIAPAGDNLLYLCAKDNTGRVGQWSGRYKVSPLGLTGTVSPKPASYLNKVTYTASATGGTPSTIQYAYFRRRPGATTWIPDVTQPNWQPANVFQWQPTLADVGTWETYIWVKDGDTPPTMNTYGYAAGFNTGPIDIIGKPTVPGPTTVSCAWTNGEDCWVQGDFTASVTASTGGLGSLVYQICRSNDSTGGFSGCDVNLTLTGGTSILVSGTHLPGDGFRRSYWFQAKDTAGALSGWNTPRYVRVDRHTPAVSADNASEEWFTSRTATVSASDAQSGLQAVRYRWNTALDATCTAGTTTASGTVLTAPEGDNVLYLCARDNVGRVAQWNGKYRVRTVPAPQVTSVTPFVIHQGAETVLTVTGTNLQGATVYVATQPIDSEEPQTPVGGFPVAELVGINAAGTALTVRIDATEAGLFGFFNLAVETPGGKTAGQFRVVGDEPVVDVLTPSQPVQGNLHVLLLAGANLQGAEVVPSDPSVKVIDLDNSFDDSLAGLLYVDSDGPLGETEILIRRPSGEVLSMMVEVVGSAAEASLGTTQVDVPGRKIGADVPDVLLQDPVINTGVLESAPYRRLGVPAGVDGIKSATAPDFQICIFAQASHRLTRSYILLGLTDSLGNPITRQVLNRLLPGQRLNFSSTTIVVTATLQFEFLFKICQNWVTVVAGCVHGQLSTMVPLVGGWSLQFNYCNGTEGPRTSLAAEGFISRHEWSTSNQCMTVEDSDPTSESGVRSGTIDVNCCAPTDIHLHTTGQALQQTFDAQGRIASVTHENCTEPSPPALRLFLDVNSDNLKEDGHLYLPEELDDSENYLPCSPLGSTGNLPGAGLPPSQLPQEMTVIAAYVQQFSDGKLKIVPPPPGVTSVEINLQQTSMLNGQATNYPPVDNGGPGTGFTDPDFWLEAPGQFPPERLDTVTLSFGSPEMPSQVASTMFLCNDYGGSTSLRVRALPDGAFTAPKAIPATSLGTRLPSMGWTALTNQQVLTGALQNTTDEDDQPLWGTRGDGLSAFSEYRGMVIGGTHYRLNPSRKDVFVEFDPDPIFTGLAGMPQLQLQIHRPLTSELYKTPNAPGNPDTQWVNVHGAATGMESNAVVAIHLVNDPAPVPTGTNFDLGVTRGEVASRGPVESVVYSARLQSATGARLNLAGVTNWVLSHELGHAVDICHRQEDQAGQPVGVCNDGATIDPQAVIPNGVFYMHSGTIFNRINSSSNSQAGPATSYHPNSLAQIELK